MSGIALVATDLDGTLWGYDARLTPPTREAIEQLQIDGIELVAATGHSPASARRLLESNGLMLPLVGLNGAIGVDLRTDERFHRALFSPEVATQVLDVFDRFGLVPNMTVDHPDFDVVTGDQPTSLATFLESGHDLIHYTEMRAAVHTIPILDFFLIGEDAERLLAAQAALGSNEEWNSFCYPGAFYGGMTLAVSPAPVDKWVGVQAYCAWKGIDTTSVLAVGDAANDIAMIRGARIGCAMSHAPEAVLEAADVVISEWAEVLTLLR